MDETIVARVQQIQTGVASGAAIAELHQLSAECASLGLGEERIYCLLSAIRVGTSAELATVAIPVCKELVVIAPRRVYLRHLAMLYELAGDEGMAIRYYRYVSDIPWLRDDLLPLEEIKLLMAGARAPRVLDLPPIDREFRIHMDLALVYFDMSLYDDASAMVDIALMAIPGEPTATALLAQIVRAKNT